MSKTVAQIFADNPVTSVGNTDLFYLGEGGTTDAAITGLNLKNSIVSGVGVVNSGTSGQITYYASTGTTVSGSTYLNVSMTGFSVGTAGSIAGSLALIPITAASGNFVFGAVPNVSGDFSTLVVNSTTVAQNQTITVPDSGAAAANFVLTKSAAGLQSITGGVAVAGKVTANNFVPGFATVATAAGTTTLTVASAQAQQFTGSTTQTVVMPVTSTLALGQQYYIINDSSGVVTVNSSGSNLIQAMAANSSLLLTCILTSGTTAASWQSAYIMDAGGSGTVNSGTANQMAWYASTGTAVSGNVNATINNGTLTLGVAGSIAGSLILSSATASAGALLFGCIPNGSGDFQTLVVNSSAVGQSQTITIPNSGASTANFVLTKSAAGLQSITGGIAVAGKVTANNFVPALTSIATAAGTTTLTVSSTQIQQFTGVTTQTVVMPVTSTLALGQQYYIINDSSGAVTVQSSGANTIQVMAANTSLMLTCIAITGTTAASWQSAYIVDAGGSGTVNSGTAGQVTYYASTGAAVSGNPNMNITNGALILGVSGSAQGTLTLESLGANAGILQFACIDNSAGDFQCLVVNAASIAQNQQIAIPDCGAANANFLLSTSAAGQIVTGGIATSVPATVVTATSASMTFNHTYIANNVALVTLTLPVTCAVGAIINIQGMGAGKWRIAQNASQNIKIGTATTTTGAGGMVDAADANDSLVLMCTIANTTFQALGAPQSAGLTIV